MFWAMRGRHIHKGSIVSLYRDMSPFLCIRVSAEHKCEFSVLSFFRRHRWLWLITHINMTDDSMAAPHISFIHSSSKKKKLNEKGKKISRIEHANFE